MSLKIQRILLVALVAASCASNVEKVSIEANQENQVEVLDKVGKVALFESPLNFCFEQSDALAIAESGENEGVNAAVTLWVTFVTEEKCYEVPRAVYAYRSPVRTFRFLSDENKIGAIVELSLVGAIKPSTGEYIYIGGILIYAIGFREIEGVDS